MCLYFSVLVEIFPLFAKIFIWIANQVESWYFARERCADEVSFWNSCFDRSTCFFYFSFLPLACQKTHDEIKKRRRNRGLRSLKNYLHTCVGGLSPPSSIPWVPSGRGAEVERTNPAGRYGIRGRKTRVRGNGRGWWDGWRVGDETFAIIVIYDRVENEANLVEALALCRIRCSSNGTAINIAFRLIIDYLSLLSSLENLIKRNKKNTRAS